MSEEKGRLSRLREIMDNMSDEEKQRIEDVLKKDPFEDLHRNISNNIQKFQDELINSLKK